jgi:hypothetical protein
MSDDEKPDNVIRLEQPMPNFQPMPELSSDGIAVTDDGVGFAVTKDLAILLTTEQAVDLGLALISTAAVYDAVVDDGEDGD